MHCNLWLRPYTPGTSRTCDYNRCCCCCNWCALLAVLKVDLTTAAPVAAAACQLLADCLAGHLVGALTGACKAELARQQGQAEEEQEGLTAQMLLLVKMYSCIVRWVMTW